MSGGVVVAPPVRGRACGAVLCLAFAAGCAHGGSGLKRPPARVAAPAASTRDDPLVRAAQARAEAERALADGAPGMFEALQVRVRGRGQGAFDGGSGVDVGARLKLERPFRTSALADSMRHGSDAALWQAHAASAEAEAMRCEESALARAQLEREAQHAQFRTRMAAALSWAAALRKANELAAPLALGAELDARRALIARAPERAYRSIVPELGALPDVLADHGAPLADDEAKVRAEVAAEHPRVLGHLALRERYRAEALSERRSRLPWLDFVQLDYFTSKSGSDALGARAALGVPLDDGAAGRAKRAELLGESERYAAEDSLRLLVQAARAALAELADVEALAGEYAALVAAAEAAEGLAERLISERRGPADAAISLLDGAADARDLVVDARARAGVAACTLKLSTGKSYEAWPRDGAGR